MAKAKYITDFEREIIKIGHSQGIYPMQISRYLGRTRVAVHQQIEKMKQDGTIDDLPLAFVVDEIAEAIRAKK